MKGLIDLGFVCRWCLTLALLLGITPLSQAANLGRTIIVDPSAPPSEDGDHDDVFRTLAAVFNAEQSSVVGFYDTVLLKPGDHAGNITIDVNGVTLKGQHGQAQTWLRGTLTINASQVTVEGLSIDAQGADYGLLATDNDIALFEVQARLSRAAGVWFRDVNGAQLHSVQALDNASAGLLVEDSREILIENSVFQANGADGLVLRRTDSVSILNATLSLNDRYGLWLDDADGVALTQSALSGNKLHGAWATQSARSNLSENAFSGNVGFGLGLSHSDTFVVSGNTFSDNGGAAGYSGGLLLTDDSLENTVIDNRFVGHSNPQGAGVWLVRAAASNRIIDNEFSQNHFGIGLDRDDLGRPENNAFESNRVFASQQAGVWSSGQDNRYVDNWIQDNNGPGIMLQDAEGERIQANIITGNSQAGVLARNARQLELSGNRISGNGSGVWAEGLSQSDVLGNEIQSNFGPGVYVSGGRLLKLAQNTLIGNKGNGIRLDQARQVDVDGNQVDRQANAGLEVTSSEKIEAAGNRFFDNANGVVVGNSVAVELRFNDLLRNQGHGLSVTGGGVSAIKNYWGDQQGPGGIATVDASNANTSQGVGLSDVFPWLTRSMSEVASGTVLGWYFENPPPEPWLYAPKLGLTVGVSGVEAERGWLSVYQRQTPIVNASQALIQHFAVAAGGAISGELGLRLSVPSERLPNGVGLGQLRLLRWSASGWESVPSTVEDTTSSIHATVGIEDLDDALFILNWDEGDNP